MEQPTLADIEGDTDAVIINVTDDASNVIKGKVGNGLNLFLTLRVRVILLRTGVGHGYIFTDYPHWPEGSAAELGAGLYKVLEAVTDKEVLRDLIGVFAHVTY